jgi:hypothetical protein
MADLPVIQAEGITAPANLVSSAGSAAQADANAFGHLADTAGQVSDLLIAHQHVVDQGIVSNLKTSADGDINTLRDAHLDDPAGFKSAVSDYRTALIAKTPSRYARTMGIYVNQVGTDAGISLAHEAAARSHVLQGQNIDARAGRRDEGRGRRGLEGVGLLRNGDAGGPDARLCRAIIYFAKAIVSFANPAAGLAP